MPHTAASSARIKKTDGTFTAGAMAQAQAKNYLQNLINANRFGNLSQALNDVYGGRGKSSGAYTEEGRAVYHASSGNGQQSVTLFYYMISNQATIFAMGEHRGSSSYRVCDYGQPNGSFTLNATIAL
ncbi:MAG TPA: hypothetical protein PKW35_21940 [Nannocystaceae bacterium]|nr:hypothetical protein [Nannocystaceae bacterium]